MKQKISEKELVEACVKGNRERQGELFNRFGQNLFAICLRYMEDYSTAQDELQNGFLHIFKSLRSFKYQGEGSLSAWLSRVMVNHCLQALRKKKRHWISTESLHLSEEIIEEPNEEVINRIPMSQLLRFIEELPEGFRMIFNLYIFEEKSHREIAQLLGIQEKSSSSQLYRAKLLLARKINDYKKKGHHE